MLYYNKREKGERGALRNGKMHFVPRWEYINESKCHVLQYSCRDRERREKKRSLIRRKRNFLFAGRYREPSTGMTRMRFLRYFRFENEGEKNNCTYNCTTSAAATAIF